MEKMQLSHSRVECFNKCAYIVYKHTCPNNKVYIGITQQQPKRRWKNGYGYETQRLFYRAILKYGWDNIKHEILCEELSKEEAEQMEIELIKKYKSNDSKFGYNVDNGGNTIGTFSNEHKKKISNALKGRNGELSPNYGKKYSIEHRKNISKSLIGRKSSMLGKHHSIETIKKMSETAKGRGSHVPTVKVLCIDTKEVYESAAIAGKTNNIDSSSIIACCRGKRKSAGGHLWKYYEGVNLYAVVS